MGEAEVVFDNCKFDNNSKLYAIGQSKVLLEGCHWNDGVLQVVAILSILITDTTFTGDTTLSLYSSQSTISNSVVLYITGGIRSGFGNEVLLISDSVIMSNTSTLLSPALTVNSKFTSINSVFVNDRGDLQSHPPMILINCRDSATFYSTTFQSSLASTSDVDILLTEGDVFLESCTLKNITIVLDSSRYDPSFIHLRNTVIRTDSPVFYLTNGNVSIDTSLILYSNGSSSSLAPLIGNCTTSQILVNFESPSDSMEKCPTVISPVPVVGGSKVYVRVAQGQATVFYYSWQNNASIYSVSINLQIPQADGFKVTLAATTRSSGGNNAPYTLSSNLNDNGYAGLTLSGYDGSLQPDGFYIISVAFTPQTSTVPVRTVNGSLFITSQPSFFSFYQSTADQLPKISLTGRSILLNVTLLDTWSLPTNTTVFLRYANTSRLLHTSGYYTFETPRSTGWKPVLYERIYLNGTLIGTATGRYMLRLITS